MIRARLPAACAALLLNSLSACSACGSSEPPAPAVVQAPVVTATVAAVPVPPPEDPERYLDLNIEHSLEATLVAATEPKLGAQLAQVAKRVMVWWLDPARDLRKGDKLEVIYELRSGEEPVIHALWLKSEKLGRELAGVRFQPDGSSFARWYDPKGVEIEERLKGGPIETYEQITSLLKDGRKHKGVDFKAPVGTPVVSPFDGVIIRKNWSFRGNGNCVELSDRKSGMHAKFLHLSSVSKDLKSGSTVKKGQIIGYSGNTGRSTAPHLHYQLERGGRVVDPFDVHSTWRHTLAEDQRPALERTLARCLKRRTEST